MHRLCARRRNPMREVLLNSYFYLNELRLREGKQLV